MDASSKKTWNFAKKMAKKTKKYPIHEKEGSWLSPGHWRGKNVGKDVKSTSESRSGFSGRDNS
jgi:hypothetical protein